MVLKAEVGRFDGELKNIPFTEGDTINTLLGKANLTLGAGEAVNNDDGDNVAVTTVAIDGETYYIVGNYKQGNTL